MVFVPLNVEVMFNSRLPIAVPVRIGYDQGTFYRYFRGEDEKKQLQLKMSSY